jgi:hypothetical protein
MSMNQPKDDGLTKTTSARQDTEQAKVKALYKAPTIKRLDIGDTEGKNHFAFEGTLIGEPAGLS